MDKQQIRQFILDTVPNAKPASGLKQVVTICPFPGCSDRSGHLYIGSFTDDRPIFYNCYKCGSSGLVTPSFLEAFNIYSQDFEKSVAVINAKCANSNSNRISRNGTIYRLSNRYISDNSLTRAKLNYINKRLGTSLQYEDMERLKIVLNLNDLLDSNRITSYSRDPRIVKELSESFLGFISADNNHVNLRNLREGKVSKYIDQKYINYNIFSDNNDIKYYIIPNEINLDIREPIKIRIAEGGFDILGVYFNVENQNNYNTIYCAMGGKTYLGAIEYFICKLGLVNIEIHLYVDLDIQDYKIDNLIQYMAPFNLDIFIHRNLYTSPEGKQEKDYGVSKDRIVDGVKWVNKRFII